MEANLNKLIMIKITNTIENLKKNNINAVYVPTRTEACALLESLLIDGESIAVGGSVTLNEIDALSLVRNGNYIFNDRYDKSLSGDQLYNLQSKAMSSDTFLTSANAITENGYLYNVDGSGTRAFAFVFGPKRVIVIAGYNKIVPDLDSAIKRVKNIAAPSNCIRLDRDTYCAKHGHCVSDSIDMPAGSCPNSICRSSVTTGYQTDKNRITVIIVGESLGY